MKRIIIVCLLAFTVLSCSNEDAPIFFFEFVPVQSVTNVPASFTVNVPDTLQITYFRPSTCHGFDGFEVEKDGETRKIAVITKVIEERGDCADLSDDARTAPLIFKPESAGNVTLRFFQGKNGDGEDQFLTLEVPIED